jgi:putative hemolysin
LAILAASSLAACSNPGATTCDEYAAQTLGERHKTERALLEAHDLEPHAMGNALGISQAVNSYCGMVGIQDKETAKQNGSSQLENAVNWTAKRW